MKVIVRLDVYEVLQSAARLCADDRRGDDTEAAGDTERSGSRAGWSRRSAEERALARVFVASDAYQVRGRDLEALHRLFHISSEQVLGESAVCLVEATRSVLLESGPYSRGDFPHSLLYSILVEGDNVHLMPHLDVPI